MNKNFWGGMVVGALIAMAVSFIGFFMIGGGSLNPLPKPDIIPDRPSYDEDTDFEDKINELKEYIDEMYLFTDRYDEEKLEQGIYKGMFESLDDIYSVYYTPEEYASLIESSSGSYSGIGCYVQLDLDTGAIILVRPMRNSPAMEAGIQPGDILVEVNGESVVGRDLDSVVAMIKGEEGTSVTLGILREGEEDLLQIEVRRAHIEVDTISYEMLENQIGYIKIEEFDTVTMYQFNDAVDDLEGQNMQKLIIDVRDNPGGSLTCVLNILDRLLPEGELLRIVDRDGNEEIYKGDSRYQVDVPIAVLVNGDSASASEVFSGCMKDRGAAVIVGTNTFGKGIVQSVIGLDDGSGFKITTQEFFTPSGNTIHGVGIAPDVEVELDEELRGKMDIPHDQDNQLQKAIEVLGN